MTSLFRLVRSAALAVALAAALAPGAASADDAPLYAATLTSLTDAPGGKVIAELQPSTPLTVLEKKDGWLKVSVQGWSPAGGERYLFRAIGQRILEVKTTKGGLAYRKGRETKEDDWGSEWQDTTVTGWLPAADTTPDLDALWQAAGDIYFSHCTRCHSLHRPREHTANQWPQTLKIMMVRAGLTAPEKALVTMLLQVHAKDQDISDAFSKEAASVEGAQQDVATEIEGTPALAKAGAAAFEDNGCSACHGEDANSPIMAGYPRLAGQSASYLYKELLDFQSKARSNDPDEAMQSATEELSADDAKAIAYWLSTL